MLSRLPPYFYLTDISELKRGHTLFYKPFEPLEGTSPYMPNRVALVAEIEQLISRGDWFSARQQSAGLIEMGLKGLHCILLTLYRPPSGQSCQLVIPSCLLLDHCHCGRYTSKLLGSVRDATLAMDILSIYCIPLLLLASVLGAGFGATLSMAQGIAKPQCISATALGPLHGRRDFARHGCSYSCSSEHVIYADELLRLHTHIGLYGA